MRLEKADSNLLLVEWSHSRASFASPEELERALEK